MVRVVVAERAVTTDDLQIVDVADEGFDAVERLLIPDDVGRVGAWGPDRKSANDLIWRDELEILDQMPHGLVDELLLAHLPDVVAEGTEVLHDQGRELVTRHHRRAPIL